MSAPKGGAAYFFLTMSLSTALTNLGGLIQIILVIIPSEFFDISYEIANNFVKKQRKFCLAKQIVKPKIEFGLTIARAI